MKSCETNVEENGVIFTPCVAFVSIYRIYISCSNPYTDFPSRQLLEDDVFNALINSPCPSLLLLLF